MGYNRPGVWGFGRLWRGYEQVSMNDLALQLKNMSHAPKDLAQVTQIQAKEMLQPPLWPTSQESDTTDTTGGTT